MTRTVSAQINNSKLKLKCVNSKDPAVKKLYTDILYKYLNMCTSPEQVQKASEELDAEISRLRKINTKKVRTKLVRHEKVRKALYRSINTILEAINQPEELDKSSYRYKARFNITWENIRYIEGYELLQKIGFYNRETNPNGAVKDHRFSIKSGIDNNIPPEYLGNTANCEFLSFKDNIKKSSNNSITFEEFCELTSYCPARGRVHSSR